MAKLDAMVAQGVAHLEAGRFTEAIAVLSQVLAQDPRHAAAYRWRARAYEQVYEIDKAEADLHTAIAVKPEDADTYLARAIFFRAHGGTSPSLVPGPDSDRYERAPRVTLADRLADLTQAIALNPALAAAYLQRGIAYYTGAQPERALADLSQAIVLHPECHAAFFWRALARYDQVLRRRREAPARAGEERLERALSDELRVVEDTLADCRRAIALQPEVFYLAHRALIWMSLGEWPRARQDWEALLTRPGLRPAARDRAVQYRAQCDTALRMSPEQGKVIMAPLDALLAQGIVHLEAGLFTEAIAVLSEVIAQDPRQGAAYRWRARAYEEIDETYRAEADLDAAIAAQPGEAHAYLERAQFLSEWGGDPEAILADLTQAITLNPTLAVAYLHRGEVYYSLAQKDRAIADCSQAIALDPGCHAAYFWRGMARQAQGMQGQSDAPPRPGYVRVGNNLYHDRRVLAEALEDFGRAIALYPDYFYLHQRALTWMTMGEWQQAMQDFEAMLTEPRPGMSQIYRDGAVSRAAACREALQASRGTEDV